MDIKNKIQTFRSAVPVPLSEAITLLKEHNYDADVCIAIFKEKSIDKIVAQTGCLKKDAETAYNLYNYDINRAISQINDDMYDANYKAIEGLTRANLLKIREWQSIEETEGFETSMDYKNIDIVMTTLYLIPTLHDIANILKQAYAIKTDIFEGYSDNDPIEEFVRRHKKLDDNADFRQLKASYKSKTIKLKEELTKHIRNNQ